MSLNVIQSPRSESAHFDQMEKVRAQMAARMNAGMRDFTLDIARITGELLTGLGMNRIVAHFYQASIEEYATLYAKHPELTPVIWSEINAVIIEFFEHTQSSARMSAAKTVVRLFNEVFPGYDINARDERGRTLLMIAASVDSGNCTMIEDFIGMGADVHAVHPTHGKAMHFINHAGRIPLPENLLTLIKHGADPLDPNPFKRYRDGNNVDHLSFTDYISRIHLSSIGDLKHQHLLDSLRAVIKRFELSSEALSASDAVSMGRRERSMAI